MAGAENKWVVGITDYIQPPADIEQKAFAEAQFRFLPDWREGNAQAEQWRRVDALLAWHLQINSRAAELLDRCKIVVRYGVGYDTVGVNALAKRGIPFCNTPDYGTEEVADTACAMVLGIVRKVWLYDRAAGGYAEGTWQENLLRPHERTNTLTVGIIGVGRIGTAVVNRLKPFGFRIVGYDPYQPSGQEKAVGYERLGRQDELLEQADIVTIHCPLTDETRGMIDDEFFGRMKKGSSLVNTARGGIIDGLECLQRALRSGRLACAGLDVLPDEPPKEHSLLREWRADEQWLRGRLIINPHAAYYSEQGWYEMRYKAAETARMFLEHGKLRNVIEPQSK